MQGKKIDFKSNGTSHADATIELVYLDAIASGTNEYVSVTMIIVRLVDGSICHIRPSQIIRIADVQKAKNDE